MIRQQDVLNGYNAGLFAYGQSGAFRLRGASSGPAGSSAWGAQAAAAREKEEAATACDSTEAANASLEHHLERPERCPEPCLSTDIQPASKRASKRERWELGEVTEADFAAVSAAISDEDFQRELEEQVCVRALQNPSPPLYERSGLESRSW